ncbi:MAG: hypothetical protein K2X87_09545 [Gemmataceae bacterium]|nr:hypothetical protein [Gemmataceae bacterium]
MPSRPPTDVPPLVELPDPLDLLRREGWPAAERAWAEYAAGRIGYGRALAEVLVQSHRDWSDFWAALRETAPHVAARLAGRLGGGSGPSDTPPLAMPGRG